MEDNGKPTSSINGGKPVAGVPEDVQEEARSIVRGAFRLFSDHNQRLADDLAEFNQKRRKATETIHSGPRRTSGRIV